MDIIEKATAFAKEEYKKNDSHHQWGHVEDVMKRAMQIAEKLDDVDYELLELGVIFHDIDYHRELTFKENYANHVENSVEVAESFLQSNNYPKEKIEKLKQVMLDHSTPYRREFGDSKVKEGQILYDSDKSIFIKRQDQYEKYFNLLYFDISEELVKQQLE